MLDTSSINATEKAEGKVSDNGVHIQRKQGLSLLSVKPKNENLACCGARCQQTKLKVKKSEEDKAKKWP